MSSAEIAGCAAAAVLVFWTVGAYNRLVGLRNDIAQAFAALEGQLQQRHDLLRRQADALRTQLEGTAPLDAVLAALGQLQTACDVARARPSDERPMTSLRLADATLADARARLQAERASAPRAGAGGAAALDAQLAAVDLALVFARRQFNDATLRYNAALRQFPTSMLGNLFKFGEAGTL